MLNVFEKEKNHLKIRCGPSEMDDTRINGWINKIFSNVNVRYTYFSFRMMYFHVVKAKIVIPLADKCTFL